MKFLTINFEGIDGAGKTHALKHLKKYYEERGIPVQVVPSVSPTEFIRAHDSKWYNMAEDTTRFSVYLTYQLNNYYKNIKPNLGKKIILIDRYIPSCFAYNRLYKNLDVRYQSAIFDLFTTMATRFFIPDITFVFDVENKILVERFNKYRKHEAPLNLDYTQQIRKGYEYFKQNFGNLWEIKSIDGSKDIDLITKEMVNIIEDIKTIVY